MESHPWARLVTGIPDGPGVLRMSRSYRGRVTRCARYITGWQYSEGDSNSTTVQVAAVTPTPVSMALSSL
jgi:hypothetical protein